MSTKDTVTRTRPRQKIEFWLDLRKPHEVELAEQLIYLRSQRQMHKAIRDALNLLFDLQMGSTQVLHEMFPQLATTPASADFQALMDKIEDLAHKPALAPPQGALRPLTAPVAPPADDDIELDIKADSEAGKRSVQNFVASLYNLNPSARRTNETIQPSGPTKLAGADVSFSAPNFDDVEDLDLLS